MVKKGFFKHIDFFIIGLVTLYITYFLANEIRPLPNLNLYNETYRLLLIFEVLSYIVVNYFYNPYEDILKRKWFSILYSSIIFGIVQISLVAVLLFSIKHGSDLSRLYLAIQYILYVLISYVFDLLWIRYLRKKAVSSVEEGSKRMLVVTSFDRVDECINEIKDHNFDFYRIVGLCILNKDCEGKQYDDFKVVCNRDNLLSYTCAGWIDDVYFDLGHDEVPEDILNGMALMGITTHLRLTVLKSLIGQQQRAQTLFGEPVLTSSLKERSNKQIFRKALIDFVGGLVGSLIAIILTIFIGPIIKIKSPGGPIFYKQERIGLNGRHFYMYKFRSMVPDAEAHLKELESKNRVKDGMMFKMEDDPRIIPGIGNFIRKTSLDEFPQFFNVLKGDMSLVGTRPPTVNEWVKYDLNHRIRMSIKPGITGLWQVSGRSAITDFNEVVKLDKEYIDNWHVGLDIKIILKTIKVILIRKKGESM